MAQKRKRLSPQEIAERDTDMFIAWYRGKTQEEIAQEHGVTRSLIAKISVDYDWKKTAHDLRCRAYSEAMNKIRGLVAETTNTLIRQHKRLVDVSEKENRPMTIDELNFISNLNEKMRKEVRLEDNKPTENIAGGGEVKIVLTGGIQDYGLTPDDEGLEIVHEKTLEKKKILDRDAIEAKFTLIEHKKSSGDSNV